MALHVHYWQMPSMDCTHYLQVEHHWLTSSVDTFNLKFQKRVISIGITFRYLTSCARHDRHQP